MEKSELAEKIFEVSYLTGEFKLRSGETSSEYFDKYQFESDPMILKELARVMKKLLPEDTEVLAGIELSGVPLATALALESGFPVVFIRKVRKEYGT